MSQFVKKTMEMDEKLIKKLRKIFKVDTDKEAVNSALKLVAGENEIISVHREFSGKLDIEDVFE